jgi:hypothetical protein
MIANRKNSTENSNLEEAVVAATKAVALPAQVTTPGSAAGSVPSAMVIGPPAIDIAALRLPQDFEKRVGVQQRFVRLPVRKPTRQEFIRVKAGEAFQLNTMLLNVKNESNGIYLVAPALWLAMPDEISPHLLVWAVTRQQAYMVWPLRLPHTDRGQDLWALSALEAAQLARKRWVSVRPNMNAGMYDVYEASDDLDEPQWPELSFDDVIKLAFKDRYISDPDHPVLRRLRGEV